MCGIAGIINFNRQPVPAYTLSLMLDALKHRGPDQQGIYHKDHISIGMRRLKIIALENGQQPCYSNDGRYIIVFNGEIYNYRTLRSELISKGLQFKTESDAEVIVNLYQLYGKNFYQWLDGMFALAIYDNIKDIVLLVRDPTGKKPLFYSFRNGTLSFSSELTSLLKDCSIQRSIDPVALDYYMCFRVVPRNLCIFKNIHKVPAGCSISFMLGNESLYQHWQVNYQSSEDNKPLKQWVNEIDEYLNQAVEKRLMAEVPIGTMLSGGLDSSLITAIALKQRNQHRLKTFAVGFNEANFNELDYSKRLAQDLGTEHYEYIITAQKAFEAAHYLIHHFGEPFAFPSSIASHFMYQLASKQVKVVLGGDGADELFGGYARYYLVNDFPDLPAKYDLPRKVSVLSRNWKQDEFPIFYQTLLTDGVSTELRQELYNQKMKQQLLQTNNQLRLERYKHELEGHKDKLSSAMQYDFNHWMQEAQMVKVDIASMANSLEVRLPFLDKEVIAFGSNLPTQLKLNKEKEKYLLYCLSKRYLPDYIINRKKQELAVPIEQWMVSLMKNTIIDTLTSEQSLSRGYFDPDKMRKFIKQFNYSHSYAIWTLYILEKWHQQFIDTL